MEINRRKRILQVAIHTAIISILAVLLSNTLVYRLTSMLALKSSVEVKDYKISDLYTAIADSSLQKKNSDNVVIVAVDGLSREQIVEVVNTVKDALPKAIGIDIIFPYLCNDDSALINTMSASNIVLAAERYNDTTISTSYFYENTFESRLGIVNFEAYSPIDVVRTYRNQYIINDSAYNSFATMLATASGYDTGNLESESISIYYPALDFWILTRDILVDQPDECRRIMKDKIVIIGDLYNMKDMHPTPIGAKNGLWIHASILETILGNHNIKHIPRWISGVIAFLSCFLIVLFNLYLSRNSIVTAKLLFRLVQLSLLYLYFWIGCQLFAKYNLCIDFAPALSMIAIGLLSYDIYFGLLALYKKFIVKINTKRR